MVQPLKLATPAVVVDTQPDKVPVPEKMAKEMSFVSVATVLPPASSIVTTGCTPNGVFAAAFPASVVKTSCTGAPTATLKALLGWLRASPASVAVRTSPVAAELMRQPLKAATPAVVVAVQPARAPGPVVSVMTMAWVSVVTVLPPASSIVTVGWVPKALPPVAAAGSVVKASWLASPVPTSNDVLVVLRVSAASVAVSV